MCYIAYYDSNDNVILVNAIFTFFNTMDNPENNGKLTDRSINRDRDHGG